MIRNFSVLVFIVLCANIYFPAKAQQKPTPPPLPSYKHDQVKAFADSMLWFISGEKGKERDWAWFRKRFTERGIIGSVAVGKDGRQQMMNLDEFLGITAPRYKDFDFQEVGKGTKVKGDGPIWHVQQRYETTINGKAGHKGTNFFTIISSPEGLKIVSLVW